MNSNIANNAKKSEVLQCEQSFLADYKVGLSSEQVKQQKERGNVNKAVSSPSRSVGRIVFDNVFTLFNILNCIIAAMVLAVGSFRNLLFMGVVISNTAIGIFQEIRAKRTVDKLTILTEPKISVVRDSKVCEIAAENVVLNDIMVLSAGNQIIADGTVLYSEGFEVDESLITGESDTIHKSVDSEVLSGSFVTAGVAYVRVMRVGKDNYAAKLTVEARREKKAHSELMTTLNKIVKVLTFAIIPIGVLLFVSQYFLGGIPFNKVVTGTAAALIGMIPEGLILLTSIAFAVSVINLGKQKTLVQSMPCIENLARVDVLCLDKTGTITSGSLQFEKLDLLSGEKDEAAEGLSALLHALPDKNQTHEALTAAFTTDPGWEKLKAIPFSSARKYSGVTFKDKGTWVLGAPEFVLRSGYEEVRQKCEEAARDGYRVMVLAFSQNAFESEDLPEGITASALLLLSDTIRPEAPSTFEYFKKQGVEIKVISGDNPTTVAAVARRAGLSNADRCIDMNTLTDDSTDYKKLVEEYTVFGRVTPYQKCEFLRALKANGHTVAMTGDGVNDVLALKEADCSIAMPHGSDAARQIADVVLLNSNFSSMTNVVLEGRRVINNIERVATLYLVKMVYSCLMAVVFILISLPFPFVPIQHTVSNALTIGIPSFFLALEPNKERVKGSFLQKVMLRSVPAGLSVVISSLLIQLSGYLLSLSLNEISAITIIVSTFIGYVVLFNVCKPFDIKKVVLFVLMVLGYILALLIVSPIIMMPPVFNSLALVYIPHMIIALLLMRIIEKLMAKKTWSKIFAKRAKQKN